MTLPSVTNALITADTTGKSVVTKEYLSAQPNSAIITTTVSITSETLTTGNYTQEGKIIKIDNGVNAINYTVNGVNAAFVKGGTGAITFIQRVGRTLSSTNGLLFNGAVNSTASIVSFGTIDTLYINGHNTDRRFEFIKTYNPIITEYIKLLKLVEGDY